MSTHLQYPIAFVSLLVVAMSGVFVLAAFYQKKSPGRLTSWESRVARRWEFTPENDSWYQKIINLSPEFTAIHPELFRTVPAQWNSYNIPYRFYAKPPSVLVLGAGTGNDVAAAIRNGAGRVVAVEIDPLILKIGRDLHFEKPYQSPRVQVVIDDARSYIQNSHEKFDVIVFSLLDSHTTTSYYSNIRIDNYVYTHEAFQAARRLLNPDGIFIVKFWVATPWIASRLYMLVRTVFDQPPLDVSALNSFYTSTGRFFIAGSQEKIRQAMTDPSLRAYIVDNSSVENCAVRVTTDDWPYFYQRDRGLPVSFELLLWFWCSSVGNYCAGLA